MKTAAFALLAIAACTRPAAPPVEAPSTSSVAVPATDDQRTLYALGALLGKNLQELHPSPAELELVKAGLDDQALGRPPQVDLAVFGPKAQQLGNSRRSAARLMSAAARKAQDQPFVDAAGKEPGAQPLAGGAFLKILAAGTGGRPKPGDQVRLAYAGQLSDGNEFDATSKRGGSVLLALNAAIPCWSEALQQMAVGDKARLVCPASLAYGDTGRANVPGGAAVSFELELLELNPPPPPPRPPRFTKPKAVVPPNAGMTP